MDLALEEDSSEGESTVSQVLVIPTQPDDKGYDSCDSEDLDNLPLNGFI